MENGRLEEGDVVQLKSGGPQMTVSSIEDGKVYCAWFDDDGSEKHSYFKPTMLTWIDLDDSLV